MARDKYGHYVNDAGVTIKVSTDKYGTDHIDFYDGPVDEPHSGIHVDIEDDGYFRTSYHNEDRSEKESGSGWLGW